MVRGGWQGTCGKFHLVSLMKCLLFLQYQQVRRCPHSQRQQPWREGDDPGGKLGNLQISILEEAG